jgi:hypothetical protein
MKKTFNICFSCSGSAHLASSEVTIVTYGRRISIRIACLCSGLSRRVAQGTSSRTRIDGRLEQGGRQSDWQRSLQTDHLL